MRRTEAARYSRWSAGVAIVLAAITLGVYVERAVKAHIDKTKAPPPPPPSVEKQSTALSFSKVVGKQTLFTVRASKSTEFKGAAEDLLEDVQITIFGSNGERHDTIHTRSCQYTKDSARITCAGDVQMDLQSAADAERAARDPGPAGARMLHVETRGVSFDRERGLAQTSEMVKFVFPRGEGQARGVEYRSEEGIVRLEKEVSLRLKQLPAQGARLERRGGGEELMVSGSSLEYRRDARAMRLAGPVAASAGATELTAGELTLALDANYHAQQMVARAGTGGGQRPEMRSKKARGQGRLAADELVAHLDSSGVMTQVEGKGNVQGELLNGPAATTLSAGYFALDFAGRTGEPQQATLTGSVIAEARAPRSDGAGSLLRKLQTEALRLTFTPGVEKGSTRLEQAQTLAAGTLEWKVEDPSNSGSAERSTKLQAENIRLRLQPDGQPSEANASGNVQVQRMQPGRPEQASTAREGTARFDAKGDWSEIVLRGEVKLREGDRRGQAGTVTFARAAQTATLSGNALATDATTRTAARTIIFSQGTSEMRAEGGVRTTDIAPRGGAVQLAQAPANIFADRLQANPQTGRALYSGHARLWQGESVLEAEAIELLRNTRVLNASGSVRAVFPQTAFRPGGNAGNQRGVSGKDQSALWHIQSDALTYREGENRARLEGNVFAQSAAQSIRGAVLDLDFSHDRGGAQQLSRAAATGGVTVTQGSRRGTSERGEYTAADGKFVLTGGTPTLYDAGSGTTTGRQLTFFLADDTIIVDSETGSRTLTKHRVEK